MIFEGRYSMCREKILLFLLVLPVFAFSQPTAMVEIPMRDGKFLAGDIYLPNSTDSFPTVLIITPYGKFFMAQNGLPLRIGKDIGHSQYAFVVVDWRCRFASTAACALGSDDGEDGYDVVEWIARQSWSNGKIGMWGPSALGNIQYKVAKTHPPHLLVCVTEVAAPQFSYEKYFPGGVLEVESLQTLDILFGFAGIVVNNPYYNFIWEIAENESMYPEEIGIPFLLVGGWYDHNTDQTLRMFDTLRSSSMEEVRDKHRLLMGPWVHGGTGIAFVGSGIQGELFYPDAAGENVKEALRFFDYYLRSQDNGWGERQPVRFFQMGNDEWLHSDSWPPPSAIGQSYYLTGEKSLDSELTTGAKFSYTYDPRDPSPTVGGKTLNLNLDQGPFDQSLLVESRQDALIFSTGELEEPLVIQGSISVNLYVSSDRPDTDFSVRVTDVFPDGRSILLGDGIQRMRFREGFRVQDTMFMHEEEVYLITIELDALAITILPGHQLRLIVTSSNYPRYNRNMNNGLDMYPDNHIDTLINPLIATNHVHTGINFPSHILIPKDEATVAQRNQSLTGLSFRMFPNPAHYEVEIQVDDPSGLLSLFQADGSVIWNEKITAEKNRFSVAALPSGIYYVQLKQNGYVSHRKLIITP
ncbi:MAG: CocE/NonD family hydrolase [Saprospiraceae bacterium]|nr:CocE/NonD family hydrolase [Saprospiraceae bacterium]